MDRLDRSAYGLLDEMMVRERQLSPSDQLLLSRWATKIAMVSECLRPADEPPTVFSQADRDRIRAGEGPPDNVNVWLAAVRESELFGGLYYRTLWAEIGEALHVPTMTPVTVGKEILGKTAAGDDPHLHLVTFHVHYPIFQVLVRNAPILPERPGWGPFLTDLWPLTLRAVPWPPSQWIDDDHGVDALARSFEEP